MQLEKLCKSEANSRNTQRTDTRSTKPKIKKKKKTEKKREEKKRQQTTKQNRQNQNQTKPPTSLLPAGGQETDTRHFLPAAQSHYCTAMLYKQTSATVFPKQPSALRRQCWTSALEINLEWNAYRCPPEEAGLERWMG